MGAKRMPVEPVHPKIGKWAICAIGRIGKIQEVEERDNGDVIFSGIKLKDGSPWQSKAPRLIHAADQEFIEASYRRTFIKLVRS